MAHAVIENTVHKWKEVTIIILSVDNALLGVGHLFQLPKAQKFVMRQQSVKYECIAIFIGISGGHSFCNILAIWFINMM